MGSTHTLRMNLTALNGQLPDVSEPSKRMPNNNLNPLDGSSVFYHLDRPRTVEF